MRLLSRAVLGSLAAVLIGGHVSAAEITGAGSTFVYPILSKWADDYGATTGHKVNYQSVGSGRGITLIKGSSLDFGASDAPLKPDDLQKSGLGQFPLVIGGIVPLVHIDGIKSGDLKLSGPVLAGIFLGKIKVWNDPALLALNPGVNLPAAPISVVYRSDGSGTTFNWVNYLSKVSPEWKEKVGEGTEVDWPVGIGGKGNEGVAFAVSNTKNSIGYVEYSYVLKYGAALNRSIAYALVKNRAGKFVKPDAASFQAAAASADWTKTQDFNLIMTDAPGDDAYPITATTFVLMRKQPNDAERSKLAFAFFRWAIEKGQKQASDLNYVPLPAPLVTQIESYWKASFSQD